MSTTSKGGEGQVLDGNSSKFKKKKDEADCIKKAQRQRYYLSTIP